LSSHFEITREGSLLVNVAEPVPSAPRAGLFLDRDGVINERIFGSYVTNWSEFKFTPGIVTALCQISSLKLPMIVVSNQAGVGKNLITKEQLADITQRFVRELAAAGARIDAVYYCPHRPDENCRCRKPATGLLTRAAADWNIDLRGSVLIGDSQSDLSAAEAVGCKSLYFSQAGQRDAPGQVITGKISHNSQSLPAAIKLALRDASTPAR
jgi:D-glycero-D-manno-heptose 1,7-bisphosphate phosphatase